MIDASVPLLPDEPSREQLDAWIEPCELLAGPRLRGQPAQPWAEVRYGELQAVLRGQPALASPSKEWAWLIAAARAHLER